MCHGGTTERRSELECANSSDALLMNLFCYPGLTRRPGVCRLLGVDAGLRPEFGVRVQVPLANGRVDRTEVDMQLGDLSGRGEADRDGISAGAAGAGGAIPGSRRGLRCRGAAANRERQDEYADVPAASRCPGGACAESEISGAVRWTPREDLIESWFQVMQGGAVGGSCATGCGS